MRKRKRRRRRRSLKYYDEYCPPLLTKIDHLIYIRTIQRPEDGGQRAKGA